MTILKDDAKTESNTEDSATGASVTQLSVVRKAAKKKTKQKDIFAPEARAIGGGIYSISVCDGKQAYVYVAMHVGKHNKLRVTEVYPGLSKKQTAAREAEEQMDLVLEDLFSNIDDAMAGIEEALGLEEDESCET